ncbi:AzlC family ABC transporter permease [Alicyclobacillus cycloheptanicus]|uniref:4-azaleucine resistance transporter AzlC n=1 Tax=Alicyclobacillus cycloheptanicus TaxID=1457 RepID=A0ABT9XMP3_9BACL|nr:AzlC family ABC transporter permease [Alicyclobacillus cycloheptanicus]MDQ0191492.1 4-azaleucine resistance transporter AzlC [Alicyclobacillus cycloheptanicus]WDM01898.1 AzlC family ABC transporter permease [Alicyclobacillus cycloheptanicus]
MPTSNVQYTHNNASVAQPISWQKDFARALADGFPLSVSVFAYGFAYGALARSTNHLGFSSAMALSIFVFAGASQFSILSLLHQGATTIAIVVGTFLLNARQMLYGLTLGPSLTRLRPRRLSWLAHGLTDESFSIMAVASQSRPITAAYMAGAGSAIFFPWQISSALGFLAGGLIGDPSRYGLDFAYIGAFLGLLAAQLKHRSHVIAAILAAVVAIVVYRAWGSSGAILAGAAVSFGYGVTRK